MTCSLLWFRQDLRLDDNPALCEAVAKGLPVLPVYVLDDESAGSWKMGAASRVWLYHALLSLNSQMGGNLIVVKGRADQVIPQLCKEHAAKYVFWNRCYEPWRTERDSRIKSTLSGLGLETKSCKASLLWEPWDVSKADGTPYRVFTPFFQKGCLSQPEPRPAYAIPPSISWVSSSSVSRTTPERLDFLLPRFPRWDRSMLGYWNPISEAGAQEALDQFLAKGLNGYKDGRDYPARDFAVSRLSPYLHFGQISPYQVWHSARAFALAHHLESDVQRFCAEIAWREFSHSLLYYNATLPEKPLNSKFESFDWVDSSPEIFSRWTAGETGFPIVDAGMRELWATGYMHNRVRMIVASFLVKDLRYHWRLGEDWFWDTLFDADLANNAASWQWVAGCGADAAPYFRIFNPDTQGQKFDPQAAYIRKWVPEYGTSRYPAPMLDHKQARDKALSAFKGLNINGTFSDSP